MFCKKIENISTHHDLVINQDRIRDEYGNNFGYDNIKPCVVIAIDITMIVVKYILKE
jgi:hypothetical protein